MHRYGFFLLLVLIVPWAGGQSPVTALIAPIVEFVVRLLVGSGL